MSEKRRYQDDEIREIFGQAAGAEEQGGSPVPTGQGLTLTELQDIGREVGLEPGRIEAAATQLDQRGTPLQRQTSFGAPIAVGRVVDLPRAPTDTEWEILVGELRRTFDARGKVSTHGRLREWTNSNLHVYVETTETGHRLRMRTLKGSAVMGNRMGIMGLGFAAVMLVVLAMTGQLADDAMIPILFAVMGGGALASNALTLPRWAREREEQMEYIAARAKSLLEAPPEG